MKPPPHQISSPRNPLYRSLLSLHQTKGIRRTGLALIPGLKVATELTATQRASCVAQVVEALPVLPDLPAIRLVPSLFRELDCWGTGPPLLVFRVPPLRPWAAARWPEGCTVIVPFQDPRNVGSALRSCAAFGVCGVVLAREAAHPFHPEAVRAGVGTQARLRLFQGPPLAEAATLPRPLVVLDRGGIPLAEFRWPKAFGLLAGMEGPGVPPGVEGTHVVSIPIDPRVESLNASVALGIALYAWRHGR